MHYYKAKLAMITLLLLLFQPIPTPTPSLVQAEDDLTKGAQSIQAFTEALKAFTPLMVLALGLLCVLVGILILGRRQNNIQPLLNSIEQDRKDRQKLTDKLFERDSERDDKVREAVEALAIAVREIRAMVTQTRDSDLQFNALFKRQNELFDALLSKGSVPLQKLIERVERIDTRGTEPMQVLNGNVGTILKNTAELIELVKGWQDTQGQRIETAITELNLARSAIEGALETMRKKKTDSQPIPIIEAGEQKAS